MENSHPTQSPTGGVVMRRVSTQPALHESLMGRVVDRSNMFLAWEQVEANRGAPGVDGMTVDEFPAFARAHWPAIREALLDGSYSPQPVRRVEIPKPSGGGVCLLGIPTVVDRLIAQAIHQVLTPIFDPDFSASSFGFRPWRSAHGAVRQVQRFVGEGYRIAVDLDLEKCFDQISHDVLGETLVCSAIVNRPVRTRMLGGVGAGG